MITFFNRVELVVTFDLELQDRIRRVLAQNDIEYDVCVRTYKLFNETKYEHRIFVRKKDEEEAVYLINKRD
ncbi:MAG: hypothetical protein PHY47_09320 [Lachnospiraceae bacterium]|nr:hypothetical protein [Lachnospiraceae bacterium]